MILLLKQSIDFLIPAAYNYLCNRESGLPTAYSMENAFKKGNTKSETDFFKSLSHLPFMRELSFAWLIGYFA